MQWKRFRAALLSTTLVSAIPAHAQVGSLPLPPGELVRDAVQNEVNAKKDPAKFLLRDHKKRISDDQTKLLVETKDGPLAIVIEVNVQPLSPQQQRWEIERVQRMLNDPDEMRKRQQQQSDDADRVSRIIKALPDAFIYEFDGKEVGKPGVGEPGEELVRLKFRPNPQYDPPTRVEQILTGMQGSILIDPKRIRIARIEGTLFKDVGFGWGILGHLDRGGRIAIEQGSVYQGIWQISSVQYTFTGKLLFFKSINSRAIETFSDFRPVPPDLTQAQGLALLKQEISIAENQPSSK